MGFTVRELLNLQAQISHLSELKLLVGEKGLSNEIRGVTIIEAPDIVKFIEGGELLLTGLYAFKSCTVKEFFGYISSLHEKEVSAIFLKQGRNVDQADEKIRLLKAYCLQHCIPLIDVPFQVSFQAIMSLIMEHLFNEEVTRLKYYKTTNDNFCALSLSSQKDEDTISKILDMLDKLIRNPVAIFDQHQHCLATSNAQYTELDLISDKRMMDPNIITRNTYFKQAGHPNRYIVELALATGQTLYLQIWEIHSSFSAMDLIAIENGIVALQYEFFRQYSMSELEQKFHNDLIQSVLLGKFTTREEIERSRVFTGLSLDGSYRVMVLGFADPTDEDHFNERVMRIDLLKDCVTKLLRDCRLYYSLNRITVIQQVDPTQSLKDYRSQFQFFFTRLNEEVEKQGNKLHLLAGVGRAVNGIAEIQYSYREANDALSFLELNGTSAFMGEEHSLFFSDLGIFKLLCQIKESNALKEFIPENLMRLYRSDSKQRDELIQTLKSYLNHQLNISQTAKELFIHYKTAMYRLNRISEITGIDFDNAQEVLSVRIGMIVHQMIEKRKDKEI